jgi:NYN domain
VYWYDGTKDRHPYEHESLARQASTTVRLGRVVGDKQKGVDSLLYGDMLDLSSVSTLPTAVVIAADTDFCTAVERAKMRGQRVEIAMPFLGKLSGALRRAADGVHQIPIEVWQPHVVRNNRVMSGVAESKAVVTPTVTPSSTPLPATAMQIPESLVAALVAYATNVVKSTPDLREVISIDGVIRSDVDSGLVDAVRAELGGEVPRPMIEAARKVFKTLFRKARKEARRAAVEDQPAASAAANNEVPTPKADDEPHNVR